MTALDLNVLAVAAGEAERQREMWRTQKAARRARRPRGFCQKCSVRPTRDGHKDCAQCRAYGKTAKQNEYDRRLAAGLCTMCGKTQPEPGYITCPTCCKRSGADFRARRDRFLKQGKCICGNVLDNPKRMECATCRARDRDAYTAQLAKAGKKRKAEVRAERIAAGCCVVCATKLTNGKCEPCSKHRRKLQNKAGRRKTQRYIAAGLCSTCGRQKPDAGYRVCRGCIDQSNKRQKAQRRARGLLPRAERPPRTHCRNGHPVNDQTTYGKKLACKPCNHAAVERYLARKAKTRIPKPRGQPRRSV